MTIEQYFIWGALGGAVGYAWYIYAIRDGDPQYNHVYKAGVRGFCLAAWGIFLASIMGGLFAIVFDHSMGVSIITGMTSFLTFTAMVRVARTGKFMDNIRDLLIRLLTGGGVK